MPKKTSKFNLYNLLNPNKEGKGVKKGPKLELNVKNLFVIYGRNFNKLISVNAFIVFGNFPFIFFLLAFSGYLNRDGYAPASQLFGVFNGALTFNAQFSPVTSALYSVHGLQTTISVATLATNISYALSGLIILTFGITAVGTTYNLRNMLRNEPVFMWSDFWFAIKKNFRQGFVMGIIDVLIIALLAYDIAFFYFNIGTFINNVMFYFGLFMVVLYFMMRFYIYLMLITFKLSIFKIIKNALIFAFLGIKRNVLAIVGIAVLVFINYSLLLMFVPLGAIFPFLILFGNGAFMAAYAAYGKIDDIMIKPYKQEEPKKVSEAIFKDMG
jgi:uncharacterized membrane protein YesL